MTDDRMQFGAVSAWVGQVLEGYDGLYDVQDHLFVRQAVRVVTKRRDACFDIPRHRWEDPSRAAAEREALASELMRWARQMLPAGVRT